MINKPIKSKENNLDYLCPKCGEFVGTPKQKHKECSNCRTVLDWGKKQDKGKSLILRRTLSSSFFLGVFDYKTSWFCLTYTVNNRKGGQRLCQRIN